MASGGVVSVLFGLLMAAVLLSHHQRADAFISSSLSCGLELIGNNLKCVRKCRKMHHCKILENFCKGIRIKIIRKICNGLLKCACPSCLKCVAVCTVQKFIKHNVCYVGKYLKYLLKMLRVYNYFDLEKQADQEEAMVEVYKAVLEDKKELEEPAPATFTKE